MQEKKDREGYDRVTSVLYPFSGMNKIPKENLDRAAQRGTEVHQAIEAIIDHIGYDETKHQGYIESFKKWQRDKIFLPVLDRLYCDSLQISGKVDAIYKESGKLILVDFKTSAREGKTWKMQGSAYSYLCTVAASLKIDRIEFIMLSKEGKEAKVFHYQEDILLFQSCLCCYREFFKADESALLMETL